MDKTDLKFGGIDSYLKKSSLILFSLYMIFNFIGFVSNCLLEESFSPLIRAIDMVVILSIIILTVLFFSKIINLKIATITYAYILIVNLIFSDLHVILNNNPDWGYVIFRDAFVCTISIIVSGLICRKIHVIVQCAVYLGMLIAAIIFSHGFFPLESFFLVLLFVLGFSVTVLIYKHHITSILQQKIDLQQEINKRDRHLHNVEVEIIKEKSEHLQEIVQYKNRELTSYAMLIAQNNERDKLLLKKIENLGLSENDKFKNKIEEIKDELLKNTDSKSWEKFQLYFEEVHSDFYKKLSDKYPSLSPTEQKLAALLKLGLTSKEIASLTYNTKASIDVARSRLRKKLNLDRSENIESFFANL